MVDLTVPGLAVAEAEADAEELVAELDTTVELEWADEVEAAADELAEDETDADADADDETEVELAEEETLEAVTAGQATS